MKKTPPSPDSGASQAGLFTKSERNRMVLMVVLLLGLAIGFVASLMQKEKHD